MLGLTTGMNLVEVSRVKQYMTIDKQNL